MTDRKKNYKGFYCSNCGNNGHGHRNCPEPITSYGILHFSIDDVIDKKFVDKLVDELKIETNQIRTKGIKCRDERDAGLSVLFRNSLHVTLVRRKHSLGFMEFIRGRYNIDNIDGLLDLFAQMVESEIELIGGAESFDELWFNVWPNDSSSSNYSTEYSIAKAKYHKLKNVVDEVLNLDFYVKNVKPDWDTPEWGLPKGRRNMNESDVECAIREFKEETGLVKDDIIIFDNIPPLSETFTGTNGIEYRHIYFLAVSYKINELQIDENNNVQFLEIGDITSCDYDNALKLIRPYQTARKRLMNDAYMFIIGKFIKLTDEGAQNA
jgi:8-oxo-dGTP pyrophosphatase MutT (NUDIX family)